MKSKKISLFITSCAAMASFSLSGCDFIGQFIPVQIKDFTSSILGNSVITDVIDDIGGKIDIDIDDDTGGDTPLTGYYANIDLNANNLLTQLQSLNSSKRRNTVGYKPMLNNPTNGYYVTDPGNGSGTIMPFYDGGSTQGTSGLNREHVWPNSRGGSAVENDIHMTRPTYNEDNGSRGNSFYVEGMYKSSGGWDPGCAQAIKDGLDPTYRGDCARIIFYCVVACPQLKLVDTNDDSVGNKSMGKLSDLLKWNIQYPVTQREKTRNDGAERLQGNRNPFIDHPEFAAKIWGNYNSTTRAVCKSFL